MGEKFPSVIRLSSDVAAKFATETQQDGKKVRKFSMVAYTGAPVERWQGLTIVDLKGMKVAGQKKPILFGHEDDRIAGYSESVENNGKEIVIEGVMSSSTQAGQEVVALADEGFPWQASIGFHIRRVEKIEEGDSKNVNGREINGPAYVVTKSELLESSFVAMGADAATTGVVLGKDDPADIDVQFREDNEMTDSKNAVEKFAAEHADAVEKWKSDARKEGADEARKAESDRFKRLHEAFGADRPEFVCAQFAKGHDVDKAKAELADVLLEEAKQKDEQIAELKKGKGVEKSKDDDDDGHDGVEFSGKPENDDKPPADESPEARAKREWNADKDGCKSEFPNFEAYARYVENIARHEKNDKKSAA